MGDGSRTRCWDSPRGGSGRVISLEEARAHRLAALAGTLDIAISSDTYYHAHRGEGPDHRDRR
jgi:hypothetical protein